MISSSAAPAVSRGDQSQGYSDERPDGHGQQSHAHRILRARHDQRQHVSPELIGAEPVMPVGRAQFVDDG